LIYCVTLVGGKAKDAEKGGEFLHPLLLK